MRRKIAKRLRRECRRMGVEILSERYTAGDSGKRKDSCVSVTAMYDGWRIVSIGEDSLDAYRMLLDDISDKDFWDYLNKGE